MLFIALLNYQCRFLAGFGAYFTRTASLYLGCMVLHSLGKPHPSLCRMRCLSQVTARRSTRQRLGTLGLPRKRPTHVEADLRLRLRHEVGLVLGEQSPYGRRLRFRRNKTASRWLWSDISYLPSHRYGLSQYQPGSSNRHRVFQTAANTGADN